MQVARRKSVLVIISVLIISLLLPTMASAKTYTSKSAENIKKKISLEINKNTKNITTFYKTKKKVSQSYVMKNIAEKSVEYDKDTGKNYIGDYNSYLKIANTHYNVARKTKKENGYYVYRIKLNLRYEYSKSQEAKLTNYIKSISKKLKLKSKNQFDRIKTIHDFLYSKLSYGGVNDTQHAAFTNSTKCMGFSSLFYMLCRYNKIPCRLVTTNNHMLNIVKLNNRWYYMDATGDVTSGRKYAFFLLGKKGFENHYSEKMILQNKFRTASWMNSHNVPYENYNIGFNR